jgi:hypothetical protein
MYLQSFQKKCTTFIIWEYHMERIREVKAKLWIRISIDGLLASSVVMLHSYRTCPWQYLRKVNYKSVMFCRLIVVVLRVD